MKTKKKKLRGFIEARAKSGDSLAPNEVLEAYNIATNKTISFQAVSQMLKSLKLDKARRSELVIEKAKAEAGKDILEYEEFKTYLTNAEQGRVQQTRIGDVKKYLREMWELMGQTNPHTWTYSALITTLQTKYPMIINEKKQKVFQQPAAVLSRLGAINTVFKGILPDAFSANYSRKAGELKDFFTFEEFAMFIEALEATAELSLVGWRALFKAQINGGFREGSEGLNGILGLKWENINFATKRCSALEKGGRGNASRMWFNVPLDLFPWINGWADLIAYWEERGKPTEGKVFPVTYMKYLDQFHKTRHKCNGRIAGDKETLRPHIFRKSHAQWLRKLRVPLEIIAGAFPEGIYGIGWDNINVLKAYYVTIEPDEYEEAQKKADERMKVLGLVTEAPS